MNLNGLGYAYQILKTAKEGGSLAMALEAYDLYNNIGKGSSPKVLSGLLKTAEEAEKRKLIVSNYELSNLEAIESILQERGEEATRKGRLEAGVGTASVIEILIGAFLIGGPNLTGNVISSSSSALIVGAIIFIAGIVGALIVGRT